MSLLPNSTLEDHPDGTGSLNAIINANWRHLDNWINPATGFTAAQSGTTVTASAPIFTSENIGDTIRFAGGQEATITATSGTVASPSATCTVNVTRTVSSATFNLFATAAESPRTALARALTKKTKAANIPAGTSLVWNATTSRFEPRSADPAPVLFMNVRSTGTNANISNSSALGRLQGRDTSASNIAAGTVIPDSQIHFEWIGSTNIVSGSLNMGVSFRTSAGVPLMDYFASVNALNGGLIKITGKLRFSGPQNAMDINGYVIVESMNSAGANDSRFMPRINLPQTFDFTVNRPFNITGQFSTANVNNNINVETFWLKHIINAN